MCVDEPTSFFPAWDLICLEEDLKNDFIMRGRLTAELVKIYTTSNNTKFQERRNKSRWARALTNQKHEY